MDEDQIRLLAQCGVEVNCENPLEISHPASGAKATGWMAHCVIEQIQANPEAYK